jgi:hypothetical protein
LWTVINFVRKAAPTNWAFFHSVARKTSAVGNRSTVSVMSRSLVLSVLPERNSLVSVTPEGTTARLQLSLKG